MVDIPEDYQKHFMEGRNPAVNIAGTSTIEYLPLKNILNGYLTAATTILSENQNISPADLVQELDSALSSETTVILEKEDLRYQNNLFLNRYIKVAAYLLIFVMFFVIGRISSYYGEPGVRKRHDIAPFSSLNNNLKLLKDNILFVVACNLILCLIMFLIKPDIILEWNLAVYFISFLLYSLCILGICYIITALAFRYEVNVILIILLAVFIALLNGDFGLGITDMKDMTAFSAEFTPVYWLIKVNYTVNDLLVLDWKGVKGIVTMLGMNVLLAAAYFSVALVINKNKSERE
ncbi:MAG: ABC-type multidrug transport system, permease component [Anaerocolumna sp.]|nr:ABC-type multidrug transport system, permease component [Anaerocolumna sp.]